MFYMVIFGVLFIVTYIYLYKSRGYDYWSKQGIPGPTPVPVFGNYFTAFLTPNPLRERNFCQKYGNIFGHFLGTIPVLNIADPELIKAIWVKDFHLFTNRTKVWTPNSPLTARNLNHLCGDDWKRVRSIVSPVFTSGKMRQMYPQIRDCLSDFTATLDSLAGGHLDAQDWCSRLGDNLFFKLARQKFSFNVWNELAVLILPKFLQKWFRTRDRESDEYFLDTVRHIVAERRLKPGAKYNDFIQLLMDSEIRDSDGDDGGAGNDTDINVEHINKGTKELDIDRKVFNINIKDKKLTEDEIIAQGYLFLLGGYLATATILAFSAYELALNPDIQQRLYDEINGAIDSTAGDIPYDVLTRLPYLDAVVSEILRRYSMVRPLARIASADYKLGDTGITIKAAVLSGSMPLARIASTDYKLGDTGITIKAGQQVELLNFALHHSERYYPDPFKFDPDRFMPENRHRVNPYAYMPFGAGPRNCIGMRFGLLVVKLGLARMVGAYRFYRCPETDVPVNYQRFIHMNT
ncbi:unnamed protein product, partial [Oppiella nova]